MTKILMILLLMTYSISCKTVNTKVICKQITKSKYKIAPIYQISFRFNRCKIKCFDFTNYKTVADLKCGDNFKSGNYNIEKCDGVMGWKSSLWAKDIRPKTKKLKNLYLNLCK